MMHQSVSHKNLRLWPKITIQCPSRLAGNVNPRSIYDLLYIETEIAFPAEKWYAIY